MTEPRRIGPYEIDRELGRGGMGVVYLGHDMRLDRKVALKALPDELARDASRLERFEREAKALAQLDHPNVAGIHGVEEEIGARFLVLEYVEGETLAERIARGPVPVDEALDLAIQIAAGVEAAHDAGVIHRDLKPGNVIVTPDGRAKVVDFGLAVSETPSSPPSSGSASPTVTRLTRHSPTVPGAILGTAAYMAPEQAKGRRVDKRADIWSFGVVLYEMVTGYNPFRGETAAESIGAVLHKSIDFERLPEETPYALRIALKRMLVHDLRRRRRDMRDVRLDLEAVRDDASVESRPRAEHGRWRGALAGGILLGVALGAAATGILSRRHSDPDTAEVHTEVGLPSGTTITHSVLDALTFTPEGDALVFAVGGEGSRRLYRRRLDSDEATPMPGTEGGAGPIVSPDGMSVAFWAKGGLWRVPIAGGSPVRIHDLAASAAGDTVAMAWTNDLGGVNETIYGAEWTEDDRIVYARFVGGLWSIPAKGGAPSRITTLSDGEFAHRTPHVLPGSHGVLFSAISHILGADAHVEVLTPGGARKRLIDDAADARWLAPDHLIFARRGSLYVVPFDLDTLEIRGPEERVVPEVMHSLGGGSPGQASGTAHYAVSSRGDLAYVQAGLLPEMLSRLEWLGPGGEEEPVAPDVLPYLSPKLAPDGSALVVTARRGDESSLYRFDPDRGTLTMLRRGGIFGIWSHDGARVIYAMREGPGQNLFAIRADGAGEPERLTESPYFQWPSSASEDGKWLLFVESNPKTGNDIWVLDLGTGRKAPWRETRADEGYPAISPDGEWIAYSSDESGRDEVYVERRADHSGRLRLSQSGAVDPIWRHDGTAIYFRSLETEETPGYSIGIVPCRLGPAPSFGKPEPFLTTPIHVTTPVGGYDVSLDGSRILATQRTDDGPRSAVRDRIRLVLGWRRPEA